MTSLCRTTSVVVVILSAAVLLHSIECLLYPKDTETRETKELNGIWKFRLSPKNDSDRGFNEMWYSQPLDATDINMPVPSSYNDITTNSQVRDFVGWAWYSKTFFVPNSWNEEPKRKVYLRFGSVHYTAQVWVNGQLVGGHSGGHLPFEMEVTNELRYWQENWVTVAVNNTLNRHTVPQGEWIWHQEDDKYPPGDFVMQYTFDFFNYAGIHRPVVLYSVPQDLHIQDITVVTELNQHLTEAQIRVDVGYHKKPLEIDDIQCVVELHNQEGHKVGEMATCVGTIQLKEPTLWWPHLMDDRPGYMYTLAVWLHSVSLGQDVYRLPIGLRTVNWNATHLLINQKNFYFRGFGKHEDSDIRGKGLDLATTTRDFELIKWIGANSFRTSHYPYAEEIMEFADHNGIVVIDECPGVNLEYFEPELLKNHLTVMQELVARDKNHPSVIAWSIANEPRSAVEAAKAYFANVAEHTRQLDPDHRPVMAALSSSWEKDQAAPALDIIGVNRYFGWYSDTGRLDLITRQMDIEVSRWRSKYPEKPVLITEYGADTIIGFHDLPSSVWTEDYQCQLMNQTFAAFDKLRLDNTNGFVGEMIWNFADFMTKQTPGRALGNRKGVFTRQRQPKASAHSLRKRYLDLAQEEL